MPSTFWPKMRLAWLPALLALAGVVITFGPPYPVRIDSVFDMVISPYLLLPYGLYLWLALKTRKRIAAHIAGTIMLILDAHAHYYLASGHGKPWKLLFWPPQLMGVFLLVFGVGFAIGIIRERRLARRSEPEPK